MYVKGGSLHSANEAREATWRKERGEDSREDSLFKLDMEDSKNSR